MKTCPVCDRRYADDVTVCPDDKEPLGAVTVTGPRSSGEAGDDTVVRPKQATPLERPRFTEVRIGPPEAVGVGVVPSGTTARRLERERPMWPLVAAVAAVGVIALVATIYFLTAGQSDLAKEVSTQITDARVAVADARARLESLPMDSPLRNKLLTLQQWDRELQNIELSGDRTREVAARARDIASQARGVGEEARVAGATIPTAPPVVTPPTPAAPPTSTDENTDPMGTKPDETPSTVPATNTAPEPPQIPTTTTAPPQSTPTTPDAGKPSGSVPEPDQKTAPSKVPAPSAPAGPEEKKPS